MKPVKPAEPEKEAPILARVLRTARSPVKAQTPELKASPSKASPIKKSSPVKRSVSPTKKKDICKSPPKGGIYKKS